MKRINLLLGAGRESREENFVHLDRLPWDGIDVVHDLNVVPWPFNNGQCKFIAAHHLLEHLTYVDIAFEEMWRLLYPGGILHVTVPNAADLDMSWSDFTHHRTFRTHSILNYLTIIGVEKWAVVRHAWVVLNIKDGPEIGVHLMPLDLRWHTKEIRHRIAKWPSVYEINGQDTPLDMREVSHEKFCSRPR